MPAALADGEMAAERLERPEERRAVAREHPCVLDCCQESTDQTSHSGASSRCGERKDDVASALATTLSAADRCDRCGAQAYVRARLASGGELLFCAHHARQHMPRLSDVAVDIQDETERLIETSDTRA